MYFGALAQHYYDIYLLPSFLFSCVSFHPRPSAIQTLPPVNLRFLWFIFISVLSSQASFPEPVLHKLYLVSKGRNLNTLPDALACFYSQ